MNGKESKCTICGGDFDYTDLYCLLAERGASSLCAGHQQYLVCEACRQLKGHGGGLKDITGAEVVEIAIRDDGKVVWINTEKGCVLRICRIGKLVLDDRRGLLERVQV